MNILNARIITLLFTTLIALLISSISTNTYAKPTATEYGTILNLSGKQRMLSQKMSKEAMLVALAVDTDSNIQSLKQTTALFDKTLKGLKYGESSLGLPATDNPAILKQLGIVESIWNEFYPLMQQVIESKAVSKEQLATIVEQNIPLLKEMNKTVGLYEKDAQKNGLKADPSLATTLNLSGKQRMLTQKMSKEFMIIALEHDTEETKITLQETHELFDRTLTGLIEGDDSLGLPGTTQDNILAQLDTVDNIWQEFRVAIESGADFGTDTIEKDAIKFVASNNLPLLKEMNAVVQLYKAAAGK
ncbi:MAG: type IV pili methyl-accepting chemotaxis transducer N-terminal domain-containing protein [Cellvibrionaceae bacterium]